MAGRAGRAGRAGCPGLGLELDPEPDHSRPPLLPLLMLLLEPVEAVLATPTSRGHSRGESFSFTESRIESLLDSAFGVINKPEMQNGNMNIYSCTAGQKIHFDMKVQQSTVVDLKTQQNIIIHINIKNHLLNFFTLLMWFATFSTVSPIIIFPNLTNVLSNIYPDHG